MRQQRLARNQKTATRPQRRMAYGKLVKEVPVREEHGEEAQAQPGTIIDTAKGVEMEESVAETATVVSTQ